jgi:hypothetical protein
MRGQILVKFDRLAVNDAVSFSDARRCWPLLRFGRAVRE